MTIGKRHSQWRHLLVRARVAVLIMWLKPLMSVTIVILALELDVVFHNSTRVLCTCTVQITVVLFKLELKWDGNFSPLWQWT